MWDGANHGWWPLLWFIAKVWTFMFVFFWLRGTLPRMRYDQFMGLGWKILIPISLIWIVIVSCARSLRNHGYDQLTTYLITVAVVVGLIILFALWRTVRARNVRKIPEQVSEPGTYPVPPLPTKASGEIAPKEKTHA